MRAYTFFILYPLLCGDEQISVSSSSSRSQLIVVLTRKRTAVANSTYTAATSPVINYRNGGGGA